MDGWDDDAFRVARELQNGPIVSASNQDAPTANCGVAEAPMAALDALIETAWSFPGFRISYGVFEGSRAIRFHTSAGSESHAALDCVRLDLTNAPRFVEALRTTDAPVTFEDVTTDSRARPIADALAEIGCRSMLILPLRRDRKPMGIVMLDRETPRTWGAKEFAALDRLAPLIALSLEYVEARAELESTRASGARHERRITAIRGLTAGVATDAERVLEAIHKTIDTDRTATMSLLGQLERIVGELGRVQRSPTRHIEPFSLSNALHDLVPGLAAMSACPIKLVERQDARVHVAGNLTGLERLLVNLVDHLTRDASSDQTLTLEIVRGQSDSRARLLLRGDAVRVDSSLLRLAGGDPLVTSDEICPALWQARCEALVLDVRLHIEDGAVALDFPTVDVDIAQSAG